MALVDDGTATLKARLTDGALEPVLGERERAAGGSEGVRERDALGTWGEPGGLHACRHGIALAASCVRSQGVCAGPGAFNGQALSYPQGVQGRSVCNDPICPLMQPPSRRPRAAAAAGAARGRRGG